jgi:hypothetical protein
LRSACGGEASAAVERPACRLAAMAIVPWLISIV